MLSTTPASIGLELTESDRTTISTISNKLKPINVIVLEKLHNIYPLNRLSWWILCLIIAVVINIPYVVFAESNPDAPNFILRLIYGPGIIFVGLYTSCILFKIATQNLIRLIKLLDDPQHISNLMVWAKKFSIRGQIGLVVVFLGLILIIDALIYAALKVQITQSVIASILVEGIWDVILALIIGNMLHFYFKFLSIVPVTLAIPIKTYALYPSETILLRTLIRATLQFILVFGVFATFILSGYLIRVAIATQDRPVGIGVTLLITVGIWAVMSIPLSKNLNAITTVTRAEKEKTLTQLQSLIDQTYRQLGSGETRKSLDDLDDLLKLYNSVRASTDYPIDVSSIARLGAGFLLPLIPGLINRLLGG